MYLNIVLIARTTGTQHWLFLGVRRARDSSSLALMWEWLNEPGGAGPRYQLLRELWHSSGIPFNLDLNVLDWKLYFFVGFFIPWFVPVPLPDILQFLLIYAMS